MTPGRRRERVDVQVTPDLDRVSEVEITFAAVDEHRTRVVLEHRHLDRHGAGWESLRDGLEAPEGWPLYLARFAVLTRDEPESA